MADNIRNICEIIEKKLLFVWDIAAISSKTINIKYLRFTQNTAFDL